MRLFVRHLLFLTIVLATATLLCQVTIAQETPASKATPPERFLLLPGFEVELLYSVPKDTQGSWINLTADSLGRLIVSSGKALYRLTVPPAGEPLDSARIEKIELDVAAAHGLLYHADSLYVVQNRRGHRGLYRVRDTDGDDRYDNLELLRGMVGSGEHGPHAIIPSPDGESLFVVGGNHTRIPVPEKSRVPRVWDEDFLLARLWDAGGHAHNIMAPGGWVARTDLDGAIWELVSIGYRNSFDIAFNASGALFTFDADMEWDVGTPWYRPTRINHVVSGSDYGWRSGTGKWPNYYPDGLDRVADMGPGSPTGIAFGYGARFPQKYQEALYVCDWSYGRMYVVHLEPDGATWKGAFESFLTAAPLPLTDVIVHPVDGALYFTTGGRGMQSGLYRVTHKDAPAVVKPATTVTTEAKIRRRLETFHSGANADAIEEAWPFLGHADRYVRFAARVAVEMQPAAAWAERALGETQTPAVLEALLALARVGDSSRQSSLLAALSRIDLSKLSEDEQLALLRVYQLTFIRMGAPAKDDRDRVVSRLAPYFPSESKPLNAELSQLLIYLQADGAVGKTVALLGTAPTQEEQMRHALTLMSAKSGWTLDSRRDYFSWFSGAGGYRGGHSFAGFIRNIKAEAVAALTEEEKTTLKEVLEAPIITDRQAELPQPEGPGREWTIEELLPLVTSGLKGRDYESGKKMFAAAQCFTCHRFGGEGGASAPDLTTAGGRFNRRDLLEAIVMPSKVIADQYRSSVFFLQDGTVATGRIVNMGGGNIVVNTNLFDPNQVTRIAPGSLLEVQPSATSMMPDGLLNRLNQDEVLDLIAYLLSQGDPRAAMFR